MNKTQPFLDIKPWGLMRPLYQKLDALDEWQAIVQNLRCCYPGRKVLIKMLETL